MPAMGAENELMLRLVGTAARIEQRQCRILDLAATVDYDLLARTLAEQKLLMLVGSRLAQLLPEGPPDSFKAQVTDAIADAREQAEILARLTKLFLGDLERAGIAAVALKGPLTARSIYGDAGMRASTDVDVLVDVDQLDRAVSIVERRNYTHLPSVPFERDLPHLHHSLVPCVSWLPPLDLHWRIHWYERDFSRAIVARSAIGDGGVRRLRVEDEFAALLLFYQRDSFFSLRYAADIAAWWDRRGHELEDGALDSVIQDNPELRAALVAAAGVAEQLVGLPRRRVMSDRWQPSRRGRVAQKLANPTLQGDEAKKTTVMSFVDLLLAPAGDHVPFLRRYIFQPAAVFAERHGLPLEARARVAAWRLAHGVGRAVRTAARYATILWSVRPGSEFAPVSALLEANE